MRNCSMPDCAKPARTRGWCHMHYLRWRLHGDPTVCKPRGYPAQHGLSRKGIYNKEYRTYIAMMRRCFVSTDIAFAHYGGRGITVCAEWQDKHSGLPAFLESMGAAPSPAHTIDRINVDGNYEPGNCRWATRKEQSRNKSNSILIDGVHIMDWCEARGIPYYIARCRYHRGERGETIARPWRSTRRAAAQEGKTQ